RLPDGLRLAAVRGEQAFLEKGASTFAVTLGSEFTPSRWKPVAASTGSGAPDAERPVATADKTTPPNG
ncbi:MAG: hypothetical protein JNN01_11985, partial [Opitutaceae bacterium]|nr:hypothetical protein [Opitutaceae bacterium]